MVYFKKTFAITCLNLTKTVKHKISKTAETLLNELFVLDQDKNVETIVQYAQEENITIT